MHYRIRFGVLRFENCGYGFRLRSFYGPVRLSLGDVMNCDATFRDGKRAVLPAGTARWGYTAPFQEIILGPPGAKARADQQRGSGDQQCQAKAY
jgi:hypothetical protein